MIMSALSGLLSSCRVLCKMELEDVIGFVHFISPGQFRPCQTESAIFSSFVYSLLPKALVVREFVIKPLIINI